jgi:hypothetical protein
MKGILELILLHVGLLSIDCNTISDHYGWSQGCRSGTACVVVWSLYKPGTVTLK